MDLLKVVAELRQELEHLNKAILSLERVQQRVWQGADSAGPELAERKPGRGAGARLAKQPDETSVRLKRKSLT